MKILMVCLGNICRSPLAEGILRSKLSADFEIDSAGTIDYHEGKKADHRSIQIAANYGVDINQHRARKITSQDLEIFDNIFCMDLSNYNNVLAMVNSEEQRQKVKLILEEGGNSKDNIEVPDPYYGDLNDFDRVYQMLDSACEAIAHQLKNQS